MRLFQNVQGVLHLDKGLLGLLKEAKDNGLAELALILVVIHLQDLFEGEGIDAVAEIWQAHGALLALSQLLAGVAPRMVLLGRDKVLMPVPGLRLHGQA